VNSTLAPVAYAVQLQDKERCSSDKSGQKGLHQVVPFYSDKKLSFLPTFLPTEHIAKTTGSDTEEETAEITSRSS
jgi:hypothetical protein